MRTTAYPASDPAALTRWYTGVLGYGPCFSEDYCVGFDAGGYELALHPVELPGRRPVTYRGVADIDAALAGIRAHGAVPKSGVREVGGGIRVATVLDPEGSVLGLIENPHVRAHGER
ncbi:VOC family protein [Streptomonospora salina]|uniref:VOC family protein n=1 Tax=Streptomonospora salina TaxID=104205 RepID=UPI001621B32C